MDNIIRFAAQLVDGAIGMAYGLTASSILLSFGIHPIVTSASVHAAEVFTTAVSGFSHWRHGNVDRAIFKRLLIPGMIGGGLGAYVLSNIPGGVVKPVVSAYLLVMALAISFRGSVAGCHRWRRMGSGCHVIHDWVGNCSAHGDWHVERGGVFCHHYRRWSIVAQCRGRDVEHRAWVDSRRSLRGSLCRIFDQAPAREAADGHGRRRHHAD
jgi:hypothetical protein